MYICVYICINIYQKTSFVSCAVQLSRTIDPTSSSASTTQQHIPKKNIVKKKHYQKKTLSKKNRPPCQVHGQCKSVLSICALPAHAIGTKEKNTSKKYKEKARQLTNIASMSAYKL